MAKKPKQQPPSHEQQMAFNLSRVREGFINPPTYFYKVGERVSHGAIKLSHVKEVLDEGKVLLLHETVTDNNYGRPIDRERDLYVAWHDVAPWRDFTGEKPVKRDRFYLNYSQRDMYGLVHMYYHFGVDMDPDYQRALVWKLEDKQALIESIFQDVDIGKFVFARLPYKEKSPAYAIIDGKQRLSALIEFHESRFKWRGKTYVELHPSDQSHFDRYPVSYAELSDRATRANILDTFVRLNTAGKPQDPKHLEAVKALLAAERAQEPQDARGAGDDS